MRGRLRRRVALAVEKSPNLARLASGGGAIIDDDADLDQKAFKSFVIARQVLAARFIGRGEPPTTARPAARSPILGGKSARSSISDLATGDPALKQAAAGLYPYQALTGAMKMARPKGFEPLTPRFVVWCSIQLSYGRIRQFADLLRKMR